MAPVVLSACAAPGTEISPLPLVYVVVGVAVLGALAKLLMWIGAVNVDRTSFNSFMEEIRDDIKKIFDRLPPSPVSSSSPLRLNDLGKKMYNELDPAEWIETMARTLAPELEAKTAEYDIQQFAFDYIRSRFEPTEEQEAKIKKVAYDNGLAVSGVEDVLGVSLRDALIPLIVKS